MDSHVEILFIGAEGKMEMDKVPAAGYKIIGLPVIGLQRKLFAKKNFALPFKLWKSLRQAAKSISSFKPDAVVGVGGYASAPTLWSAQNKSIPTLIQEQNSYAGLTNKFLGRRAKKICVAYENMDRFFPKSKIIFTGNPVRQDLADVSKLRQEAFEYFELDPKLRTVLLLGGSLGARTMNLSVLHHIQQISQYDNIQLIWQIGELYAKEITEKMKAYDCKNVKVMNFIKRMDYAFAAADLVISRAGAGTISELCVVQKPCILVPSPNVTEDHQTFNAMALVNKQAAILIPDSEAVDNLIPIALKVAEDEKKLKELSHSIGQLAITNAADTIAKEVLALAK